MYFIVNFVFFLLLNRVIHHENFKETVTVDKAG